MNIPEELKTTYGRPPKLSHEQQLEAYDFHTQHSISLRALARFYGTSVTSVKYAIKVIGDASVKAEKRRWGCYD
ncbi:MAG: hypothetical protein GY829_00855 [Gammaproteobacteria bacterium]|nr:hypothetical protein [Gammaproteobacteria bacterium]